LIGPKSRFARSLDQRRSRRVLARLRIIDQRLRPISTEDAASVLAGGLRNAGIHEQERLRLIAETERILDELDGKNDD
jgi:hypothetical protein